jgi:excinuclease UvrABC nuclease subunit
MATGQLWLLPVPRPLVERFGEEFFRSLPERPGVYLMCGASEGVLYVGKAKNLRKRLGSYRVANPERLPRRIIRLLHCVTRIEFDICPTQESAHHREQLLICALSPRFNAAGKVWPTTKTNLNQIRTATQESHAIKHSARTPQCSRTASCENK